MYRIFFRETWGSDIGGFVGSIPTTRLVYAGLRSTFCLKARDAELSDRELMTLQQYIFLIEEPIYIYICVFVFKFPNSRRGIKTVWHHIYYKPITCSDFSGK